MTDNYFENDDLEDDFDTDELPSSLRSYIKKLEKAKKDHERELQSLRTERNERLVGEVLTAEGFKNPKRVQRDLLADKIDPTDTDAVKSWLAENGDDYARGQTNTQEADSAEQNRVDEATQQEAAARQAINSVRSAGTPNGDMSTLEAAQAEITPDMDGAAVAALFAKRGV